MPTTRPVRGATLNHGSGRFNPPAREADGDWLDTREGIDGALPSLRTTVTVERPRTIISRNASPDVPFDRSINPYRGCDQPRNGCVMSTAGWEADEPSSDPITSLIVALLRQQGRAARPPADNQSLRRSLAER